MGKSPSCNAYLERLAHGQRYVRLAQHGGGGGTRARPGGRVVCGRTLLYAYDALGALAA
ncbi:hypothetical protein SDC9_184494 [bioreactor metagenome]|uniref:Uncharacterized protein n=1 Tax=bioreactor metagenome TaxID=1076179 RepID=A0A645HF32_9ZZZZ